AHAIEPQFGKQGDGVGANLARINLDRIFATRPEREVLAHLGHQRTQLIMRQKSRRTAAEMNLRDLARAVETGSLQRDLTCKVFEVFRRATALLGNDLVATTVVADRIAERNVEVQRQRPGSARFQPAFERFSVECLDKAVGGGIRCIPWSADIEAADQIGIKDDSFGWFHGECSCVASTIPDSRSEGFDTRQTLS